MVFTLSWHDRQLSPQPPESSCLESKKSHALLMLQLLQQVLPLVTRPFIPNHVAQVKQTPQDPILFQKLYIVMLNGKEITLTFINYSSTKKPSLKSNQASSCPKRDQEGKEGCKEPNQLNSYVYLMSNQLLVTSFDSYQVLANKLCSRMPNLMAIYYELSRPPDIIDGWWIWLFVWKDYSSYACLRYI